MGKVIAWLQNLIGIKGADGSTIASASNPLPVSGTVVATTGGLTQTQLETEFDEKLGDLGQKTSAGSAPVVLSSDQSAIPVKLQDGSGNPLSSTAGALNVDVTIDNVTASENLAQVNGQAVNIGIGTAGTGTQRVAVSSDSFPAVQSVSGTVTESNSAAIKADVDEISLDTDNLAPMKSDLDSILANQTNKTQASKITDGTNVAPVSATSGLAVDNKTLAPNAAQETGGNLAAAKTDLDEIVLDTDNLSPMKADLDSILANQTNKTQATKVTDGTNVQAIKAASTPAAAADPSAVVAFSPNSPVPSGTNLIGKAGFDETTPGTTNKVATIAGQDGVQGGTGATTANTQRVTIATDDALIADFLAANPGAQRDFGNEHYANLGANASFVGTFKNISQFGQALVLVVTDKVLTSANIEYSNDGTNPVSGDLIDTAQPLTFIPAASPSPFNIYFMFITDLRVAPFYRVNITNGAIPTTTFQTFSFLGKNQFVGSFSSLTAALNLQNQYLLTRSVVAGTRLDGSLANVPIPEHGRDYGNEQTTPLTNGSPVVFTADFTTGLIHSVAHGLVADTPLWLTNSGGALPTGLSTTTLYYVTAPVTTDNFKISTSRSFDFGQTASTFTDNGTGTQSYIRPGEFTGVYRRISDIDHFEILYLNLGTTGLVEKIWSSDGIVELLSTPNEPLLTSRTAIQNNPLQGFAIYYDVNEGRNIAPFYKLHIVNGPANQSATQTWASIVWLIKTPYAGNFDVLSAVLNQLSRALLVRAVQAGLDANGVFTNSSIQGRQTSNSTAVPLGANAVYRGTWYEWQSKYVGIVVDMKSDVVGTLHIDFSTATTPTDGNESSVDDSLVSNYDPSLVPLLRRVEPVQSRWVRVRYVNGATMQSLMALDTAFVTTTPPISQTRLDSPITSANLAATSRAVLSGQLPSSSTFANVGLTAQSDLRVGQQGVSDAGNSANVTLPAYGGTPYVPNVGGAPGPTYADMFVGQWFACSGFAGFGIDAFASAVGTGWQEWSFDGGATISRYETSSFGPGAGAFTDPPQGATHGRQVFQNTSATTNTWKTNVIWRYLPISAFTLPAGAAINPTFPTVITKGVGTAASPNGNYVDARAPGRFTSGSSVVTLPGNTGTLNAPSAAAVFRGAWFQWQGNYAAMVVDAFSDVAGNYRLEFSQDDAPTNGDDSSVDDFTDFFTYDPVVDALTRKGFIVQSKWVRAKYVNGPAAQTVFELDVAFLTTILSSDIKQISQPVSLDNMATIEDAITSSRTQESVDGFEVYAQDRATNNATTGKRGKNFHQTGTDIEQSVKALPHFQTGQIAALPTSATKIPVPTIANPKTLSMSNIDPSVDVFYGTSSVTTSTGDVIFARGGKDLALGLADSVSPDSVYVISNPTSGTQLVTNRDGTGTSTTTNVTNPNNLLADDSSYAIFTAQNATTTITGITHAGTLASVAKVRTMFKGRKAASPTNETVTHQETQVGSTTGSGTVSSASLSGGNAMLYVAAISRNDNAGSVTAVTGAGLSWVALVTNVTSGNRRIDTWYAYGNATSGAITASLQNSTNAHISVGRYTNADPVTPIQSSGSANGTGTTVTGPALAGTNGGISRLAVSHTAASGTAGAGYVESSDQTNGTGGNVDSLATERKGLTSTGTETATYTLASSSSWAAIAVTINPVAAINPVVTVQYQVSGVTGPTSLVATFTSNTDATASQDVTSDRSWSFTDVDNTTLVVTSSTQSAANLEGNRAWLEVTEQSAGGSVQVSYCWIGGSGV